MNAKEKRDAARDVDVYQLAQEIAPHLPAGWALQPPRGDNDRRTVATFGRVDGAEFYLCLSLWPGPEIGVRGCWPKLENWGTFEPRERPAIAFDPFKAPAKAAGDIMRRFLPLYLPLYEEQRKAHEKARDDMHAAAALVGRLASILGGTVHDRGKEGWDIYHIGEELDVQVSRWGGVKLMIQPTDDDERNARAVMVASFLASWRKAAGA